MSQLTLTPDQQAKLENLLQQFLEWNSKINLSAIRDENEAWEKHVLDSLLPMSKFSFSKKRILDIGTGGGFPVLPLAVMNPSSKFSALDSVGKKMKVVQAMADDLNLKVKAYHGRIEEFGQNSKFREQYDLVTARALAPWPVLLEYALPFVKVGGSFLAYQGPQIEEDLEVFKGLEKKLGAKVKRIEKMIIGDSERIFVELQKTSHTARKYPRANGIPRKMPLEV